MRRLLPPEEAALVYGKLDELMTGLAGCFARVDPLSIKHTVTDEQAGERTHPSYYSLAEQWEHYVQAIQALRTGQAFIRLPDDTVRRVATPTLPAVTVPAGQLHALRQHYLATYFRPLPQSRSAGPQPVEAAALAPAPSDVAPALAQPPGTAATTEAEPGLAQPISRHRPDEPDSQPRSAGPVVWQQPGRRR